MRNLALWVVVVSACSSNKASDNGLDASTTGGGSADAAVGTEDLDMKANDFECVLRWTKVGGYRITNKLGHDAAAVANNPNGGKFPVGTIIQIVPGEAMVKRRAGFSTMTHDWEFFALGVSASGTTITKRGTTDVVNAFGGNCFGCHNKATPQFDLVCATTHGCDPLPISEPQLINLQNGDPRCP